MHDVVIVGEVRDDEPPDIGVLGEGQKRIHVDVGGFGNDILAAVDEVADVVEALDVAAVEQVLLPHADDERMALAAVRPAEAIEEVGVVRKEIGRASCRERV